MAIVIAATSSGGPVVPIVGRGDILDVGCVMILVLAHVPRRSIL